MLTRFLKKLIVVIKVSIFYKIVRNIFYTLKKYYYIISATFLRFKLNNKIKQRKPESSYIPSNSCGYIYIAFGNAFYKECIDSVKMLKTNTKYPVHLFTDQENIPKEERDLFLGISHVKSIHKRSKVDYIHLSPFSKTIYLDTDIFIVYSIDDIFELLSHYSVVATLDTARKRENISKLIPDYNKIPYAFGEVNGGLLGFDEYAKNNIIKNWSNIFYKHFNDTNGWDQPSLRILLWNYKSSLYILPPEYNIRSKKLIAKLLRNKGLLGKEHMHPRAYHMHISSQIYDGKYSEKRPEEILDKLEKESYDIIY